MSKEFIFHYLLKANTLRSKKSQYIMIFLKNVLPLRGKNHIILCQKLVLDTEGVFCLPWAH